MLKVVYEIFKSVIFVCRLNIEEQSGVNILVEVSNLPVTISIIIILFSMVVTCDFQLWV